MQLSVTRPRCCNGERTRPEDLAISGIVAAELWTGVMKSRAPRRNAQALDDFLALVEVLGWPLEAARVMAKSEPISQWLDTGCDAGCCIAEGPSVILARVWRAKNPETRG